MNCPKCDASIDVTDNECANCGSHAHMTRRIAALEASLGSMTAERDSLQLKLSQAYDYAFLRGENDRLTLANTQAREALEFVLNDEGGGDYEDVLDVVREALAAMDAPAVEKPNVERVARSIGAMVREWATGHNPWKGEGLENVIRTRLNRFYGHEPADAPESAGEEG